MKKSSDVLVFIPRRETACGECGEALGRHAWVRLAGDSGAVCLSCADLDHLVFLPRGDAALTRRSRKHSTLSAVVLKWSRARRQYERPGVLVEESALQKAEEECLQDADIRARRREREAQKRSELDREYVGLFAAKVREFFPGCPEGRETVIAEHACLKYSGRVGRSAAAKELDEEAVRLAVNAHIRHAESSYDELLASGMDKVDARREVWNVVEQVTAEWEEG
jgi:hypothetical protein